MSKKNSKGEGKFNGLIFLSVIMLSLLPNLITAAVDDETCLGCHDDLDQSLAFTPHRLSSQYEKASVEIGCTSCHSNGSVHIEDPSVDNIGNPSNEAGLDAYRSCTGCHQPHNRLDNLGMDAHNVSGLNCSSCHKVHGRKKSLLLDEGAEFCLKCHGDTKTDFMKRSNHPLRQGVVTCLNCHKFSRRVDDNLSYDRNRICQDCHPDKGGPYLYEHEPSKAYSVEGSGCVECHEPHGSDHDRLLKQSGDNLCSSCHMVPQHFAMLPPHDFKDYGCLSCHNDIHGSFISNLFLKPDLPSKFGLNCFKGGCHKLAE